MTLFLGKISCLAALKSRQAVIFIPRLYYSPSIARRLAGLTRPQRTRGPTPLARPSLSEQPPGHQSPAATSPIRHPGNHVNPPSRTPPKTGPSMRRLDTVLGPFLLPSAPHRPWDTLVRMPRLPRLVAFAVPPGGTSRNRMQ